MILYHPTLQITLLIASIYTCLSSSSLSTYTLVYLTENSTLPSIMPSNQPSHVPSSCPTSLPISIPSSSPSSSFPSSDPSSLPSSCPSSIPSSLPSSYPSSIPSSLPSSYPSSIPSSSSPSSCPSSIPSSLPSSSYPSSNPSLLPSSCPSSDPSGSPSYLPSCAPSADPSAVPTSAPSLAPTPYFGDECVGVITYELFSTTPFDDLENNVTKFVAYQSPIWLALNCKSYIREYTCGMLYQEYGVWYNNVTGTRTDLKYCPKACATISKACADFFELADTIGFKYKGRGEGEDFSIDPETFVGETCLENAAAEGEDCYILGTSEVQESEAVCPDPTVIPDDKTLDSRSEVFIPRFDGSECSIACPNLWYRRGTFYLNSYVLFVVSALSCVLGVVTLGQHASVVREAWSVAAKDVTLSVIQARKKCALSEQVVILCLGVSVSNACSVVFMLVNGFTVAGQSHPLQCSGNAGFLLHNAFCVVQGSLIVFTICWQQAWTGRICSHIYCIVRPYDYLSKVSQLRIWRAVQTYFCYAHPVVCTGVFLGIGYIGNYWKSEYNFCGPMFGKSWVGDLLFFLLVWLPVMVIGPSMVLLCSTLIIRTVKNDIRPSDAVSSDRFNPRSTEDNTRPSDLSLVSVEFGNDGLEQAEGRFSERNFRQSEKGKSTKSGMCAYFSAILSSLYLYRRIVFLIVSSAVALGAAGVIANTTSNIQNFAQISFYDCMLRKNAYSAQHAGEDECGGQALRIEVSWRIFVVQIFMVSFGIGPFFAFGTESVRAAFRRMFRSCWSTMRKAKANIPSMRSLCVRPITRDQKAASCDQNSPSHDRNSSFSISSFVSSGDSEKVVISPFEGQQRHSLHVDSRRSEFY